MPITYEITLDAVAMGQGSDYKVNADNCETSVHFPGFVEITIGDEMVSYNTNRIRTIKKIETE